MPDDDNLKEDPIEMKSCRRLQLLFNKFKLEDFWCAEMKAFPSLGLGPSRLKFIADFRRAFLACWLFV